MKRLARTWLGLLALGMFPAVLPATAGAQNVVTYHNDAMRSGLYVTPNLDWTTAANVQLDPQFKTNITGNIYAQPLYWQQAGNKPSLLIVATEGNKVYALNATTGATVWQKQLGNDTPTGTLPCGDIHPAGITGAPVIDPTGQMVYVDALVHNAGGVHHMVYGLSLAKGAIGKNWPVDVGKGLQKIVPAQAFSALIQGERSALALVNGELFIAYGGNSGDCRNYNGWAVGLNIAQPAVAAGWATRAVRGGAWGQSGIAYDGTSMFLTTGNTFGTSTWGDGEAVIRLGSSLAHSSNTADYFAPANWQELDNEDLDLGGTAAVPVDVPTNPSGTVPRILALGKDGNAYLLDRANLGGIGGQLAVLQVSTDQIRTAAAAYTVGSTAMVAFEGTGYGCPGATGNLTVLGLTDSNTPISVAWCASFNGLGAPMVTTTDGTSNPIVWVVGAEGDNKLYGFKGTDGTLLYTSSSAMAHLHRYQTLIAANNRLYVASDGKIYAFTY